ncbi:TetR family transcriptional regulator [Saccharothrix variisporea]|uniref:TetR family transcriptional regulator n=1 Tax=Saccharothrix variisporea TaxID=543527 RepID=A0A495XEP9_9PSEU|nr:TetR family transcriptional regulator [Saccharothrix variisporea]
MPKVVDHDQRRREIVEALWHIASTRGLEGVSLGEVATAAGVSKGLVQHYFGTRDQLLMHATGYLRERVEQRIAARVAAAPDSASGTLRAVLVALLPTDDDSRTESLVANAFLVRAHNDPVLTARFREGTSQVRNALTAAIGAAQRDGDLRADLDPAREADLLLALVSGLGEALLLGHHTPDAAVALLDHHLGRLATAGGPGFGHDG